MKEKNLPIKLVMQKAEDTKSNDGGGRVKFFGEVTSGLQTAIEGKFEQVLDFYQDVFSENELVPAVAKITVKPEAIAKSHKPNDLCRKCPIIGGEDLGEIFIKLSPKSIQDTIKLVRNPPSERFKANLTAVDDISPITPYEKISKSITQLVEQNEFDSIKRRIKVKLFDFDDEFDNTQIMDYVFKKIDEYGFGDNYDMITYGSSIMYIKVEVETYDDVVKLAGINGVKTVDFFQEYSQPLSNYDCSQLEALLDDDVSESDITIGIIDGGISDENDFLKPYIVARETHVNEAYQNHKHATFIASMIQYGNELNGIETNAHSRYKFVDIIAIPNSDKEYGLTDSIGEMELMEIIEDSMEKYSDTTKIWNLSTYVFDLELFSYF